MRNSARIRVGAVNYLNTKPLVYGLRRLAPEAELTFDLPSRLADGLAQGRYEVALIPSIEMFADPSYSIVSDACIACRGPVLSVKLFSRVPLEAIRTLALDEGSRTSIALVRILLQERFGLEPKLESLPIGDGLDATTADAVLLIGDRAIHSPPGKFTAIWDLGDQWCRWAELPFVFAMWTARAGVDVGGLEVALSLARDEGVEHLDEIAAWQPPRHESADASQERIAERGILIPMQAAEAGAQHASADQCNQQVPHQGVRNQHAQPVVIQPGSAAAELVA